MAEVTARQLALRALEAWREEGRFADAIAHELLGQSRLGGSDRAFSLELFYGTLRNLTLLDFWIGLLRHGSIDQGLRDILRLGLYQVFLIETADHAAVFETVQLAPRRTRGMVNAVLRSAIREKSDLRAEAEQQPASTRFSHPAFLVDRWSRAFGADNTIAICRWDNQPPPTYARINQLKVSAAEWRKGHPQFVPLERMPDFVHLPGLTAADMTAGDLYIQDPSTTIACQLVDPQPGDAVLDACAAPGGKTGYLAQSMQNRGRIVACDRDPVRLSRLQSNMDRLGVRIVEAVQSEWGGEIAQPQGYRPFDRILVDAPCTNTGVMRRRVDVRWRLDEGVFAKMQALQLSILHSVAPRLRPGGVLVYSTCSIESEENEEIVDRFVKADGSFRMTEQRSSLPYRDGFDGAFAARLQKD
jgi:16S rRNA (cytosine967-C5)-methyltransferase